MVRNLLLSLGKGFRKSPMWDRMWCTGPLSLGALHRASRFLLCFARRAGAFRVEVASLRSRTARRQLHAVKGPGLLCPSPSHTFLEALYLSRSLALPNLSLAVPLVWSERPSAFFSLSPVTAPAASLALPFALSRAPSPLSWLLLFLPTCSFSLLRLGHVQCTVYPYALRLKRLRLERGGETSLFTSCREEFFSETRRTEGSNHPHTYSCG